jgi:hypothetical protein
VTKETMETLKPEEAIGLIREMNKNKNKELVVNIVCLPFYGQRRDSSVLQC